MAHLRSCPRPRNIEIKISSYPSCTTGKFKQCDYHTINYKPICQYVYCCIQFLVPYFLVLLSTAHSQDSFDSCADPRFNGDSLGLKGFQKVECGEIQFQ